MKSLFHWLGADAERVAAEHLEQVKADAEAMRRLQEEPDE